jgi:sortase A
MTIVAEPTTPVAGRSASTAIGTEPRVPPEQAPDDRAPLRPVALAVTWVLLTVVAVAVVLLAVGPVSAERDQRALLAEYRVEIEDASNQAFGLGGIEVPTEAPAPGSPVAVLDIGSIGISQVVVEGTEPAHTRQGPGHVVGTGGPGQPGNSVIVGRRSLFGGPFAELDAVEVGDQILVTTSQGRSLYEVEHVDVHTIETSTGRESATTTTTAAATVPDTPAVDPTEGSAPDGAATTESEEPEPLLPDGAVPAEQVYGPSPDDRLTLVTSATGTPGAAGEALIVVARMDGQAYPPTPQGGRTPGNDGRSGASGITAALILALLAYVAAVVGAIWLNRNVPWRSAYLLTAPVLVALTIVLADELVALLPAWS